jgi:hypothetical protein
MEKKRNLERSENLIKELIWARYIKNDSVPKEKISVLFSILQKYMKLFSLMDKKFTEKRREGMQDWFVGVLSSEVEEVLDPSVFLKESLNYEVFSWFRSRFLWEGHGLNEKERDIQMFIAVHRSLTKSDKAWIRHRLLKAFIPGWENLKEVQIQEKFEDIVEVQGKIENQLRSPYQARMFRFVQGQFFFLF